MGLSTRAARKIITDKVSNEVVDNDGDEDSTALSGSGSPDKDEIDDDGEQDGGKLCGRASRRGKGRGERGGRAGGSKRKAAEVETVECPEKRVKKSAARTEEPVVPRHSERSHQKDKPTEPQEEIEYKELPGHKGYMIPATPKKRNKCIETNGYWNRCMALLKGWLEHLGTCCNGCVPTIPTEGNVRDVVLLEQNRRIFCSYQVTIHSPAKQMKAVYKETSKQKNMLTVGTAFTVTISQLHPPTLVVISHGPSFSRLMYGLVYISILFVDAYSGLTFISVLHAKLLQNNVIHAGVWDSNSNRDYGNCGGYNYT
ncbi:hypothetical protein EV421DRAFT_1735551 [Armillaria borealis]|uniref:Uncharacterized protein n=1 Tax=Armillaria borealis TaxID=47425 RepID=A0AA39JM24_9AGAR|nr:hypothetical protein EV421DRAFT_1735551 [Armillaria borealis]